MWTKSALLALCVLFVAVTVTGAPATAESAVNESVEIAAVYPNPVAEGDAGEFVVLESNGETQLQNWSLADDDSRVALPNVSIDGRVVLSTAPNRTRNLTDGTILQLPTGLALANSGERLTLRHRNRTVDTVSYADAPEGEVGESNATSTLAWRPLGATDFPVVEGEGGAVRAFVLPDGDGVPAETLRGANEQILLAGYTLTANRTVETLLAADRRGVDVRVLVDGSPVGGLTSRAASALDRLAAANVTVTVAGGRRARYEFHHAKYAIVDDRALVTTENWKPVGTGGHGSRGWGAVVDSQRVVSNLTRTFRADANWRGSVPWQRFRRGQSFEPAEAAPANETYPRQFESERLQADRVELLQAPDNAERRLLALLDNATESILVEQVAIGGRQQPFLQAAVRAANRGVRVRILLSGAWYVEEDNRALVEWLNQRASEEDLPLTARLADPRGRFEKIHAKGVVVDGDQVVVGSLNWNNHSARENREVALLLAGDAVGDYYTRVFEADWKGGRWRLPVGLAVAVVFVALFAALVGRRIDFDTDGGDIEDLSRL